MCGVDASTGDDFDHRKQWIVSRLKFLSYIYAIDICAYAVMSNHYHVVLHVDKARTDAWTDLEVAERWVQLYSAPMLVARWMQEPAALAKPELEVVQGIIAKWRERLHDISWFMRGVNETIARMANEEDKVKGRFWEGRFKSQALLDETAVLTCMAYVDLNPVRAGIEIDVVKSDFTSIQQRLFDYIKPKAVKNTSEKTVVKRISKQRQLKAELKLDDLPEAPLMPFDGSSHTDIHAALPFTREDYFELVDATGRMIREDKKAFIPSKIPPILLRFGIKPDKWLEQVQNFSRRYGACAGSVACMQDYATAFNKRWCKGVGHSKKMAA
ncbi:MAG TPA: transposase [Marinagarivorans sp.]